MTDDHVSQHPDQEAAPGAAPEADPVISEAVQTVANRFGVDGLEQLIALAQEELVAARRALDELGG